MKIDRYQELAARTISGALTETERSDMALVGMIGELGEVAELFKKSFFHGRALDPALVVEECGDFLWYVSLAFRDKKLSEAAGREDFFSFDEAAVKIVSENPVATVDLSLFQVLNAAVAGTATVGQALLAMAVLLYPHGGLAQAAARNVRKLEKRHGLEEAEL